MVEHDADREADDGAEREAERRLPRRERALSSRSRMSGGWPSASGSQSRLTMSESGGIVRSSTTNGRVQPVRIHSQR